MRYLKNVLLGVTGVAVALLFSACSTMMEAGQSQLEVPTLEAQANRVAVGMGIVRENNMIANMPIASDSRWPEALAADITAEQEHAINEGLDSDPYFATHRYSDAIQLQILGGYFVPKVSALTYRAFQKIVILYGEDATNWPSFFEFNADLSAFQKFRDGTPKAVEAVQGDMHESIGDAVIALLPENYQEDLRQSRAAMREAAREVLLLEGRKGELETVLKADVAKQSEDYNGTYTPLTLDEKLDIDAQITTLETEIETQEAAASETEEIYFTLLDNAAEAVKNAMDLDAQQVGLARNIYTACEEIRAGAGEAGTLFTLALANIGLKSVIQNIPKEMKSLAIASLNVPPSLRKKYKERMARITKNAIYLLPTIAMGSYYATKQYNVAGKYMNIAEIIIEADDVRKEAEQAAQSAVKEAS